MFLNNKYPYTDFHELNLDWILCKIKEYCKKVNDFIAFNRLVWRGLWDGNNTYPAWSIVTDDAGNVYISLKYVPKNVPLTNEEYWMKIFDFEALYKSFDDRIKTNADDIADLKECCEEVNTELSNMAETIANITSVFFIPVTKITEPEVSYSLNGVTYANIMAAYNADKDLVMKVTSEDVSETSISLYRFIGFAGSVSSGLLQFDHVYIDDVYLEQELFTISSDGSVTRVVSRFNIDLADQVAQNTSAISNMMIEKNTTFLWRGHYRGTVQAGQNYHLCSAQYCTPSSVIVVTQNDVENNPLTQPPVIPIVSAGSGEFKVTFYDTSGNVYTGSVDFNAIGMRSSFDDPI